MPGTTLEARSASTASPIDDVMQNRSPNVAAAHSMMSSAGASSSSAPQCETSSRSSSGERPSVSIPRDSRAVRVVAAVMTVHSLAWMRPASRRPSIFREKARRQPRHSHDPCVSSCGHRSCSPQ